MLRTITALLALASSLRAQSPLVLQTDFGLADGSVAAMKGVALSIEPRLVIHDLTHQIPPYDIREAALRLRQTMPWWPQGTVFVSVVDPGVGTERRAVVARTRSGHYVVTPDNGTLTWVADVLGIEALRIIDPARHRLPGSDQSHTFHGRDLFVVVGARLAAGQITLNEVGPPADPVIVRLNLPAASRTTDGVRATVIGIDKPFGNVWTNAAGTLLDSAGVAGSDSLRVTIRRGTRVLFQGTVPYAATFGAVARGRPLVYLNSLLDLAVALNQGDFASRYGIVPGDVLEVRPALMPHVETFLRDLAVVLVVAAFTTVICQRLRLPVVVGYIVAGIITGPGTPPALVTDTTWIRTLAELGVVLLMYVIGLEFSLRRLARLLPITGPAAAVETSLMLAVGFMVARLAGWDGRASLFAGGVVAISSTMIVAKAFEEQRPPRRLEDLVFGILIVEDLVAILLLVALTALGTGQALEGVNAIMELLKLIAFLAILLAAGMLIVPRAVRSVVALKKEETTLVAAVGIAFLFALMAEVSGYSVALGAFLAGALVRESGVAHHITDLVRPVRDIFAAIFFVAVGMLVEPAGLMQAPWLVLGFTVVVLAGKLIGVTLGGFLSGFGLRTAVQAGMTLAQIGEFSFVIAGVGLATNAAPAVLYQVAVAVSVITALLTPLLMRLADPLSAVIDRHLPKPVQTVVTLYESWVELMRRRTKTEGTWHMIRRPLRWMLLDAVVLVAIALVISQLRVPISAWLIGAGVPSRYGMVGLFMAGLLVSAPFAYGLVNSARRVAVRFADAAMPKAQRGVDAAHAPRGALVVAIHFATVIVLGLPLLAVTQPFLSAWPAAAVIGGFIFLLTFSFWRSARDLQGHALAGAELIVDVISRQGVDKDEHAIETVQEMLPGMGTIVPFKVEMGSGAIGRTLGELNLRGLTGVSVVAISRNNQRIVFPKADQVLHEGDVLALTGSHDAIYSAHRLLGKPSVESASGVIG